MLSVALTPDGLWVLSGSKDRGVQFWNPRTGDTQLMLQGHKNSGMLQQCIRGLRKKKKEIDFGGFRRACIRNRGKCKELEEAATKDSLNTFALSSSSCLPTSPLLTSYTSHLRRPEPPRRPLRNRQRRPEGSHMEVWTTSFII